MFETMDKLMLAGLGAMSMTKEKAEKIFDEYVSKGKTERENRSGFVKEMLDNAEKSRNELEKMISDQVRKVVKQMEVATSEDISRLEGKIDKLAKEE